MNAVKRIIKRTHSRIWLQWLNSKVFIDISKCYWTIMCQRLNDNQLFGFDFESHTWKSINQRCMNYGNPFYATEQLSPNAIKLSRNQELLYQQLNSNLIRCIQSNDAKLMARTNQARQEFSTLSMNDVYSAFRYFFF